MMPKQMITAKLTEFVTDCEDDLSLTKFVVNVYNGKFAHSTKDINGNKLVFVYFNDDTSKVYTPKELIEEILEDESKLNIIPETVHYIKDHVDYKKRVNRFNEL